MNRRIGRQRGFLGLIVILIALLIVAWLSMDALKQYGVMSGTAVAAEGRAGRGTRARTRCRRAPSRAGASTTATPAPMNALDKARGLEGAVREQAAETSRGASTKAPSRAGARRRRA